jgi:hypothetical protein
MLTKVTDSIAATLDDPGLDTLMIARAYHMSVRSLQALLQPTGSVGGG